MSLPADRAALDLLDAHLERVDPLRLGQLAARRLLALVGAQPAQVEGGEHLPCPAVPVPAGRDVVVQLGGVAQPLDPGAQFAQPVLAFGRGHGRPHPAARRRVFGRRRGRGGPQGRRVVQEVSHGPRPLPVPPPPTTPPPRAPPPRPPPLRPAWVRTAAACRVRERRRAAARECAWTCGSWGTCTTAAVREVSMAAPARTATGGRPSPVATRATTVRRSGRPSTCRTMTACCRLRMPCAVAAAHRTGTENGRSYQPRVRPVFPAQRAARRSWASRWTVSATTACQPPIAASWYQAAGFSGRSSGRACQSCPSDRRCHAPLPASTPTARVR